MGRTRPHRQAEQLRGRGRHRRVPERHPRARARGLARRPRALPAPAQPALPDARGDQRRGARRRAGDRAPLRPPDDRALGAPRGNAGSLPRALSRVGRHPAAPPPDRRRERRQGDREQPASPEPDALGAAGVRARDRRRALRRRRVPRRVDRVPSECADRARGRRPLRRRRGRAPRAWGADGARPRAAGGARPDRGCRDLVARGRVPRRGGRDRRAAARAAGPELDLRVQPRRATAEEGVGVPDASRGRSRRSGSSAPA